MRMRKLFPATALVILSATAARADVPPRADDIIKKIEARFVPAEARPGQKVMLKIELKLKDGWYTYPTKQPEKDFAANVNKIRFTEGGDIRFTGKITDPPKPLVKEIPELMIKLYSYPGGGAWECEAVVSPDAKPGEATAKVRMVEGVVGADSIFPPKAFDLKASINVVGTPVPSEKAKEPKPD